MNLMMNMNFTHEIAAQRRAELMAAADRHRMRRWFPSKRAKQATTSGPTGGRVLPLNATPRVEPASANPAGATPVTADREHASARVA